MKIFSIKPVIINAFLLPLLFACNFSEPANSISVIPNPGVNQFLQTPAPTANQNINDANVNPVPSSSSDLTSDKKTILPTPKISEPPNSVIPNKIPVPAHIVIVVLENHAFEQIIDDSAAPYLNELANTGALFTDSYGLTHPSQPNYLLLFSGSNQGITDDNYPANLPFSTPNLAASLLAKKHSFIGYSEGLPSVGYKGATSGLYASKHSPWVYWQGTGKNMVPPEVNRPFTDFPKDFNSLPDLSFVIPNLDDDMHNGIFDDIVKAGDKWIKDNINSYAQWAKTNNSLLILTFDEDNYFHGNNIATIIVGEMVKPGKYSEKISHFNLLRTIEDIYGLPYAGESLSAAPITDCWKKIN